MSRQPITFVAEASFQGESEAEAITKVKARAAKFGIEFKEDALRKLKPGPLRDQVRKEQVTRSRKGLPVGFDLYSAEETEKQRTRSARFGTAGPSETNVGPLVEQEAARQARAEKYGLEYSPPDPEASLNKAILLEERSQVHEAAGLRPDALHVYGVDVLSTADILAYFEQYGATYVEWVNDSSCNVLFADKFAAKRALVQLADLIPSNGLPAALQAGGDVGEGELQHAWYKSKVALTKQGVAVPLLLRVAASLDSKNYLAPRKSRHLWKMPVRKALAVASGQPAHPASGGTKQKQRRRGVEVHGKRGRVDADGDTVMGELEDGRKWGGRRRKMEHAPAGSRVGRDGQFLRDDDREMGAGSYLLSRLGAQEWSRGCATGEENEGKTAVNEGVVQQEAGELKTLVDGGSGMGLKEELAPEDDMRMGDDDSA